MRPMERTLIAEILDSTESVSKGDAGYEVADEHRASLYLGRSGGTTVLADLVRIRLHDEYVEAEAKDRTVHCVLYEPIFGLAIKRPRSEQGNRTGF